LLISWSDNKPALIVTKHILTDSQGIERQTMGHNIVSLPSVGNFKRYLTSSN
jgi:hypothetical protein